MGTQLNYSKTGPGYKDRPSGAAWAEWGRVGPSRAGEGLCIGIQFNYSKTRPWLQGLAKWGRVGHYRRSIELLLPWLQG